MTLMVHKMHTVPSPAYDVNSALSLLLLYRVEEREQQVGVGHGGDGAAQGGVGRGGGGGVVARDVPGSGGGRARLDGRHRHGVLHVDDVAHGQRGQVGQDGAGRLRVRHVRLLPERLRQGALLHRERICKERRRNLSY